MSIATKPSQQATSPHALRRIWKAPRSASWWIWLAASSVILVGIVGWFLYALHTQKEPDPIADPLRLFGIISYSLVLVTVSYTLRRRFVRGLPGKVQSWVWMHIWLGIITIFIAMMHEDFRRITHEFCKNLGCLSLTNTYGATSALYALIFLVLSGIVGRLLDLWQTRVIAQDASSNGVGIMRALEERILELEYTVERLCAGKSEPFKQFCLQAIQVGSRFKPAPAQLPMIISTEHPDFKSAYDTLDKRANLAQSLQRQLRARRVIAVWRTVHIVLATLAVLVISYHSIMELLVNVFGIVKGN